MLRAWRRVTSAQLITEFFPQDTTPSGKPHARSRSARDRALQPGPRLETRPGGGPFFRAVTAIPFLRVIGATPPTLTPIDGSFIVLSIRCCECRSPPASVPAAEHCRSAAGTLGGASAPRDRRTFCTRRKNSHRAHGGSQCRRRNRAAVVFCGYRNRKSGAASAWEFRRGM